MNDEAEGTKPAKAKKAKKRPYLRKGFKWTPEQIAKRQATRLAKSEAKAASTHQADVIGAIAALRRAKRYIRIRFCEDPRMDFGDVELGVLEALRLLQGG